MTDRDRQTFVADRAEAETLRTEQPAFNPAEVAPTPPQGGSGVFAGITPTGATPAPDFLNPVFEADRVAIEAGIRLATWGTSGQDPFAERALRPVVDHLDRLTREDPSLRRLITEDIESFAQLSDDEAFARVRSGEVTQLDGFVGWLADTAWEAGADEAFTRWVRDRNQASEAVFQDLRVKLDASATPEGRLGVNLSGTTGFALDAAGNLAVSFDTSMTGGAGRVPGALTGPKTLLAKLDPDVKIETQADLLGAIRSAAVAGDLRLVDGTVAGLEDVEEAVEPLGFLGRNVRGTAWEPVMEGLVQIIGSTGRIATAPSKILDATVSGETPLLDEIAQNRSLDQMAALDAQLGGSRPKGFIVASLAVGLANEINARGGNVSETEAMSLIRGNMSEDEISQTAQDFLSMTRSELVAQVEATEGEITPGEAVAGAIGEAFDPAQKALEVWSDISQQIGVQAYDFIYDQQQGWTQVATGDIDEGLERFRQAYTEPADFDLSPAQWFAKKGFVAEFNEDGTFIDQTSLGQGLNLFTEFWADPTNLIGVGVMGGTARRLSRQAITDARFADVAVQLPEMRRLADDIGSNDMTRAIMSAFDVDGADGALGGLLDAALKVDVPRSQVEDAIKATLPSTPGEGNFIGRGGFTRHRSNSVGFATQLNVLRRADLPVVSKALDSRQGRKLIDWFVNAGTDRRIDTLEPYEGVKRVLASLYHSDEDGLVRWAGELRDVAKKGGTLSDARLGELAVRLEDLKRQVGELDEAVKLAGPSPTDVQKALDDTMRQLAARPAEQLAVDAASVPPAFEGGTPLFHGSRQGSLPENLEGIASTPTRNTSSRNLFGPGFYTTSNPQVAATPGYGGRQGGSISRIEWVGDAPPSILDAEAVLADDISGAVVDLVNGFNEDIGGELAAFASSGQRSLSEMYGFTRSELRKSGLPLSEADEMFEDLNLMLADRGFNAIQYQGGARTNSVQHDAFVWITPEQLRVSTLATATPTSQLEAQARSLSAQLEAGSAHSDLATRRASLMNEMRAIRRLQKKDTLADTHQAFNDLILRIYDEWAVKMNAEYRAAGHAEDLIPVKAGVNRLSGGVPVRDWSNVTMDGRSLDFASDDISRVAGFAGDDAEAAALANGVGMFNAQAFIPLPASPAEMLAARGLASSSDTWKAFRTRVQKSTARKVVKGWRGMWSALVLWNPETAIRTGLDEALGRFPLVTGDLVGTGQAIVASVPGLGRYSNRWIDSSYVRAAARGSGGVGTSWDVIEQTGRWAGRKGKWTADGRAHVERFINGGLLQDDVFTTFARFLDDPELRWLKDVNAPGGARPVSVPAGFHKWWEDGGAVNVRSFVIDLPNGGVRHINGPDDAFAIMWDVWNSWLDTSVRAEKRGQVAGRILDAASGKAAPLDVDGDAAVLNYIHRVQAQAPNEEEFLFGKLFNPMQKGWEFSFANPSARRQGVIMQRLMDRNVDILREAHTRNGKFIVTADELVKRYGMNPEEAAWAIKQGTEHPVIRNLMQEQGVVTDAFIEKKAFLAARREAQDMMYQLSATTRAGQAVDNPLVAPFFRAQTDFIGWWGEYLTRPLQMRITPQTRQALGNHPFLQNVVEGIEGAPALANMAVRSYRNLAHFYGVFGGTSGDDQTILERVADRVTFLPGPWSDDWLTKIAPGPGVVTGAAMDALVDDESTMQALMDQLWPQLGWSENSDIWELAFPNPTRGIRNFTAASVKGVASMLGHPPDTTVTDDSDFLTRFVNVLERGRNPIGVSDYENMLWAKWLAENGRTVTPGSTEWNDARQDISNQARAQAFSWSQGEWGKDTLAFAVPFYYSVVNPDLYSSDRLSLESFAGLMEDDSVIDTLLALDARRLAEGQETGVPVDPIFESNLMFDEQAGGRAETFESSRLARAWARWRDGTATKDDRQFLGDSLSDLFFNRLEDEVWADSGFTYRDYVVALHPEMGMAMVSSIAPADTEPKSAEGQRFWRGEYDEDGNEVSPAYVSGDGTRIVNIPPGPAGRDLRREALEKGWVVDRPFEDRAADAHNAYLVARSKVISLMWTMETGRDYGSDSATRVSDGQVESGVKKSLRDRTFTVGDNVRFWADKLGLSIPSETMTYQTFRELVEGWKRESAPAPFDFEAVLDRTPGKQMLTDDWGAEQLESIRTADKLLRQNEIEGFDEWPDETRAAVREIMSEAYNRGLFTREEYDRNWRGYFGELDFKPPTPPKVEDLVLKVDATPNQLSVVDGDGINIHLEDGDLPVRIIGLLAPDDGQPGYEEAADNLARVLANANTVTFGVYDPETFGTTQLQGNNRKRVLMFVYVDGKPLFDQSVFTAESPTGSQGQPRVSDLEAILGK